LQWKNNLFVDKAKGDFGLPFYWNDMNNEIKYLVYKNNINIGSFKNLALGIAQIKSTCLDNIDVYQIRDIVTQEVLWDGLINGSSTNISIDT